MAVNETRDMLTELHLGSTDGAYKTTAPDRGGEMSLDTITARANLATAEHYDYRETPLEARHKPTGLWSKWNYGRR